MLYIKSLRLFKTLRTGEIAHTKNEIEAETEEQEGFVFQTQWQNMNLHQMLWKSKQKQSRVSENPIKQLNAE